VLANGNTFSRDFAAKVEALGGTVRSVHNGAGVAVVTGLTPDAATSLAALNGISEVDADAVVSLPAPAQTALGDALIVTGGSAPLIDPTKASRYSWQWNMRDINAPAAWAAGKLGDKSVTAAIIDTGIDYDGLDLNGLVDVSRSISLTSADNALLALFPGRLPFTDFNDHGTNVASQVSSNAKGLAGVTAKTTIIAVKVLGQNGSGLTSNVLNGILYAADHGADVANMSLGGSFARAGNGRFTSLITRVMNYASHKGMLVVVAAGNDAIDLDHNGDEFAAYCDLSNVMCVSAVGPVTSTGSMDLPANYTNFGRAVDVAGPGGNFALPPVGSVWPWGVDGFSWVWNVCSKTYVVISGNSVSAPCLPGNRLHGFIGTSQATPHVTGLAASVMAQYGKGNPAQTRVIIEHSADDLGKPGRDPFFGFGRINVGRAVGAR
jgi:hypothetical protein